MNCPRLSRLTAGQHPQGHTECGGKRTLSPLSFISAACTSSLMSDLRWPSPLHLGLSSTSEIWSSLFHTHHSRKQPATADFSLQNRLLKQKTKHVSLSCKPALQYTEKMCLTWSFLCFKAFSGVWWHISHEVLLESSKSHLKDAPGVCVWADVTSLLSHFTFNRTQLCSSGSRWDTCAWLHRSLSAAGCSAGTLFPSRYRRRPLVERCGCSSSPLLPASTRASHLPFS